MFNYIFGPAGSGKSHAVTDEVLKALRPKRRVFLIVPEQEVLLSERRIADAADAANPPISCESLNVLSFRRLANLVFRTHGGLRYFGPTDGARLVIMWQVTEELAPLLKAYKNTGDRSFPELMLSACDEMRRSAVTPAELEKAEARLPENDPLRDKLHDLSLIYSGYQAMLSGNYTDPSDDVSRLAAILHENSFFKDCDVFFDSFNGFTSAELNVIRYIVRQAENVTFSLCMPRSVPNTTFETVKKTKNALDRICNEANIVQAAPIFFERSEEYYSPLFRRLERGMRSLTEPIEAFNEKYPASLTTDSLELVRPRDEFSEAEYAATKILNLVQNGARFRDIAVVTRGIDRFAGVLDASFSRFGIPYFMSQRRTLSETPILRAVIRALSIIDGGWHAEDVMAYLKTGELSFSGEELNELESYVSLWQISGKRWTDDGEWSMNPDGYTDRLTEDGFALLNRLNALRNRIRLPLLYLSESLSDAISEKVTLRDGCKAIYEFLLNSGIFQKYENGSQEDATAYNALIELLDMLVHVGHDIPINARMLAGIISMAADKTDFGAIPEQLDTVTIGDAALLRAGSVSHVIMLGCVDGVFPRAVADDGFFSDAEKDRLAALNLKTADGTLLMNDDELFYFYRAASAASASLSVSCPIQSASGEKCIPSSGYRRISELFSEQPIPERRFPEDFSLTERTVSAVNATELARYGRESAEGYALAAAIRALGDEQLTASLSDAEARLSSPDASVSPETANRYFGGDIPLSQSQLEKFKLCRFAYYSNYILGLNREKRADFSAADTGNFIHRVLEKAVAELFDENGLIPTYGTVDLNGLLDRIINEVVQGMVGKEAVLSARLSALIGRLHKTAYLLLRSLIEEFKNSKFVPSYFEMKIGRGGVTPFKVQLDDGSQIYVHGRIDRIDTYTRGNDVFVRVVDYKTGSREHSVKNISKGLDLQLLLYLFAIWQADRRTLNGPIGVNDTAADGKIYPAAALYQESTFPSVTAIMPPESSEHATAAGLALLKRTGLVLDDPQILEAMDSECSGRFLPIKTTKNGITALSGSSLQTLEGFGLLAEQLSDILREIGGQMRTGSASAHPMVGEEPCKYCDFAAFCRNKRLD